MEQSNENLIVESLSAAYERNGSALEVFRSVSFSVRPGEVLGLFGSNGCGKSTLLRAIAGLKTTQNGRVHLPVNQGSRQGLAVLPQDFRASFFNWASLKKNIRLTLPNPIRNWRQHGDAIERMKQEFGIDLDMRLRPQACSGGMLQQAAMIRAFASEPKVLLADEPFSALDINVASKLRRVFARLVKAKGVVVLAVLHDLEDIVEVCDRVLVIPKPPFSTNREESYHHARIIKNANLGLADEELKVLPFIEIAERMLGKADAHDGPRQSVSD